MIKLLPDDAGKDAVVLPFSDEPADTRQNADFGRSVSSPTVEAMVGSETDSRDNPDVNSIVKSKTEAIILLK